MKNSMALRELTANVPTVRIVFISRFGCETCQIDEILVAALMFRNWIVQGEAKGISILKRVLLRGGVKQILSALGFLGIQKRLGSAVRLNGSYKYTL